MDGVILVGVGRSRPIFLCTWCQYTHDHFLQNQITIHCSINFPIVICLPTVSYFSREATSEINDPWVYLTSSICNLYFAIFSTLFVILFPDLYYQKTQKYLAAFYLLSLLFASINLCLIYLRGIDNPSTQWVARIFYLYEDVAYIVLWIFLLYLYLVS